MNNAQYNKLIALNGQIINTSTPIIMAIINTTPDSFYQNSRATTKENILKKAQNAIAQGATILDIGGYSTRPGADNVSEDEEIQRISLALQTIRQEYPTIPISIDTFRANVAQIAVKQYNANIINDVS